MTEEIRSSVRDCTIGGYGNELNSANEINNKEKKFVHYLEEINYLLH